MSKREDPLKVRRRLEVSAAQEAARVAYGERWRGLCEFLFQHGGCASFVQVPAQFRSLLLGENRSERQRLALVYWRVRGNVFALRKGWRERLDNCSLWLDDRERLE
jgi:hypothetical protein